VTPEWIDIGDIPLVAPDARAEARARDEPWSHPFEAWNRALAARAQAFGARVMLDGVGGDSLFQVSSVFLGDLFRAGRWLELRRQWKRGGGGGTREFLRTAVKPALPAPALSLLAKLRGMSPPRHYLQRPASPWIRGSFLREHRVIEQDDAGLPPLPRTNAVIAETHAYLTYPPFPRLMGHLYAFALREGVELRSPLMDSRVVRFAVPRPWHERASGNETKILLRRAMRGLLPDPVLAPRPHRTGTTSTYFSRGLRGAAPLIEATMEDMLLVSMGMVEPNTLRRAWAHFLSTGDDEVGVRIYFTLQTELWLREREDDTVNQLMAGRAAAQAGAS
jgi:hypothetical protein